VGSSGGKSAGKRPLGGRREPKYDLEGNCSCRRPDHNCAPTALLNSPLTQTVCCGQQLAFLIWLRSLKCYEVHRKY